MPHRLIPLLVVAAMFALASSAAAQGEPLQGTVLNSSGSPVVGAEFELRSAPGEPPLLEGTTDDDGLFSIPAELVRPGIELHLSHGAYRDMVVPITAQQLVVTTMTISMVRAPKTPTPAISRPPAATPTPVGPSISEGQRRKAVELYNEAVEDFEEADDDDPAAKKAAEQKFRLAASMDPTFREPVEILLNLAMKRQNWAEASRYAEDLIRIDPRDLEAIRTQYSCMVIMQHHVRIGESARRLVKVDPNAIESIDEHAQLFFANQNYRMSAALYEVLTDIAPDPTNAFLNLGLSCAGLGDEECTRTAFEGFLERAPDDHAYVETVRQDLAELDEPPGDSP